MWLDAGTAKRQEWPVRLFHSQQCSLQTRASDSPMVKLLHGGLQPKLGISVLQCLKVLEFKHLRIMSQFSVSSEKGIMCAMAKQLNPFELIFYQFVCNSRTCLPCTDVLRIKLFVLVKHSGMTANAYVNLQRFSALRWSTTFILYLLRAMSAPLEQIT